MTDPETDTDSGLAVFTMLIAGWSTAVVWLALSLTSSPRGPVPVTVTVFTIDWPSAIVATCVQ